MSEVAHPCPRCQTEMARGAIRIDPLAVSGSTPVRWVGEDGEQFRIGAYRCATCGLVELSATERPVATGCLGSFLLLTGLGVIVCVAAGRLLAG